MIRQRLPLPAASPRCPSTRQVPCVRAGECARAVEPHAKGRETYDFSTGTRGPHGCVYFLPIQYAERLVSGPRVHEAPGGLG
jgi:hypothetical protein